MNAMLTYCAGLPLTEFGAGEVLIAEGPPSGRLFVLAAGTVEVVRGRTQILEVSDPGAIFGEIAALLGGAHTATVRAVTPVRAYLIEGASERLRAGGELTYEVASLLARRLTDATAYLADLKRQFADRSDHLGMVDEVLDALVQRQATPAAAGAPARSGDSRL